MNILFNRNSGGLVGPEGLSPLQTQVDGLVGGFVHQATDWRSLAAMVAGGMAYRAGRVGAMGLGSGNMVRALSVGAGLTAEVSAFELTHRGLTTLSRRGGPMWPPAPESTIGGRPHRGAPTDHGESNLWKWSGPNGLRQGLLQSLITFGTLKGAGRLARRQNFFVQHLFQDSAMVAGHQASAILGIAPRPAGTLTEQFLHAEATNLSVGAGMALSHRLAPRFSSLERGLDLATNEITPYQFRPRSLRGMQSLQSVAPFGLVEAGFQFAGRTGESLRTADVSDRIVWGVLLATAVVGLYRLSRWWIDSRIETAYHGPRPGEAHLNSLRVAENPRLTHYHPVNLGEIRTALLVADAIFANAENLQAMSSRLLLGSHRVFDLFFDRQTGELKEAYEIMTPQPYYPPRESETPRLLHARIGRLIDLNQFADLTGEPLLALRLAPGDTDFRLNDFQLAFPLRELIPRASRKFGLPLEGDLRRLIVGPAHSPMGPISIEKNSEGHILKGAQDWEELYEELAPDYLTRNGRTVSPEGAALRALDVIQYDDLTLRWIPPRRQNSLEEYAWLRWAPGMAHLRGIFTNSEETPAEREKAMDAYMTALKSIPLSAVQFLNEERRMLSIEWKSEFERSSRSGMLFYRRALNKIDEKLYPSLLSMEEFLTEKKEGEP